MQPITDMYRGFTCTLFDERTGDKMKLVFSQIASNFPVSLDHRCNHFRAWTVNWKITGGHKAF